MSRAAAVLGALVLFLSFAPRGWTSGQGDGGAPPGTGTISVDKLDTAIVHAHLALAADTVGVAQHHLQHVINCLEGINGKDYKVRFQGANAACEPPVKLLSPVGRPIDLNSVQSNVQAGLNAALAGMAQAHLKGIHAAAGLALRYLKAARAAMG